MTTVAGDPNPAELAAYMAAVRQHENGGSYAWTEDYNHSGHHGAYQIGGPEWAAWAVAAGVNPADHSPAAQDRVAAGQITRYYRQFGSWRSVSIAWYGGPGKAAADKARPGSVDHIGDPPIATYVADIQRLMAAGGLGTSPTSAGASSAAGWNLPGTNVEIPGTGTIGKAGDTLTGLASFFAMLASWDTWRRVLYVLAGAGLIAGGLSLAGADTAGLVSQATQLAKATA